MGNMNKTKVNNKLRIFEAFAGIGAQRKALSNIRAEFEVAGMAEWFVPAIVSYQAIHGKLSLSSMKKVDESEMIKYLETKTLSMDSKKPVEKGFWRRKSGSELQIIYSAVKASEAEGNIFDVTTLWKRKLNGIDLLTYSFPCQDLSQQGKQKGMSRGSGTRSGLLWEIEKALDATDKKHLPKYLLMENVMALMSKVNAVELKEWMDKLESLGYKNDIAVLNAGDFGSSQARRRAFMISTLNGDVRLPEGTKKPQPLSRVLDAEANSADIMTALSKYKITPFSKTNSNISKGRLLGYTSFNSEAYVYDPKFTGPTLTASGANSRIKIIENGHIRKMNAREAYQYMGFDKKDFEKVNSLNLINETKMIYTCGNSISVEVLEAIMNNVSQDWKRG